MESLITSIADFSVFFFAGFISFLLSLRLLMTFVKWRMKTSEKRLALITNELNEQKVEIEEIEREFNRLDGGKCDPCTKDTPNIGCPTRHLDERINKLRQKSKKFKKDQSFFIATTRIISTLLISPLGIIISFITNSDTTNEGSKL